MQIWQGETEWKYLKTELLFFLVFFYLFPILTDLEYNTVEVHHASLFLKDIGSNLLYGTFNLLAFIPFYKLVQIFLFRRRILLFVLTTVAFMVCFQYYMMGIYYFIGHFPWFSGKLHRDALKWYQASFHLNFSIIYIFQQFICIVALAYYIRSARQDEQVAQLKEQQLLTELNYLKAQLHPHFFFNTMNNIYALAQKKSPDTATLVAKLADMMRYILYEADQKSVPLGKEIDFITNYVEVEQIRHHQHISISIDVQGIRKDAGIEPLLLLPFIENAFKHGLQEETEKGFVSIIICMTEKELTLAVDNSKPAGETTAAPKGIGLQNVMKRLNLLYPGHHQLDIKEDESNYQVYLTLQTA